MVMRDIARAHLEALQSDSRSALATVARTSGSTPQEPGARLLLMSDGSTIGTVGGGAIEQRVLDALSTCRLDGKAHLGMWDLGFDLGMCCGGEWTSSSSLLRPPRLVVFGGGHVARPTAALALTVGFAVTIVDDHEELRAVPGTCDHRLRACWNAMRPDAR
jgi:xanthine dehydrogenase accessory factor